MEALKPWPLTKGEKLMILNIMPSSMVVLYVVSLCHPPSCPILDIGNML